MTAATTTRPSLYLSQDAGFGRLSALEFGAIDDGQPLERWVGVGEHVGLLHDGPDGRCIGFLVLDVAGYDPDDPDHAELWDAPRFDVPSLGLTDVPPNAIIVATRALFGAATTVNRELFSHAIAATGEVALRRWLRCLQSGDSMAHYGIGYTLYEMGRHQEAYRHLRHYVDLAPAEAWSWAWYARAAAAIGEMQEARDALECAMELDDEDEAGAYADAVEILEELDSGTFDPPATVPPAPSIEKRAEQLFDDLQLNGVGVLSEGYATLLVDLEAPVQLHVDRVDGELTVRSCFGVVAPDDLEDDELSDMIKGIGKLHGVEMGEEGDLWVLLGLPPALVVEEVDLGLLRAVILGASRTAADNASAGALYDIPLLAPPSLQEQVDELTSDD